jgi:outer membrane receptor protein involved in Fe transport
MKILNFIIFWLFVSFFTAFAQQPPNRTGGGFNPQNLPAIGKISGKVIDKQTQKPLEFATIALLRIRRSRQGSPTQGNAAKDSVSIETGAVTNDKGEFTLEQVKVGRFFLKIDFIGYKTLRSDTLLITPKSPEIVLPALQIAPDDQKLEAVEIIGEKAVYETQLDKKIFNVEKNITATGGTVTDVLQNIPSVTVDIDGNVAMRGSSNVTILIDGKPSGLTGANRAAALSQIPASAIERVEIISNPSARYDADGMSGIINIITKKNKLEGLNGNASIGVGTRNKYNAALNLSYKVKKINVYGNYSYRFDQRYGFGYGLRQNKFQDSIWNTDQFNNQLNKPHFHIGKIGLDYYLNTRNTLNFSVAYSNRSNIETEEIRYENSNRNRAMTSLFRRDNVGESTGNNFDYTLNFKHLFPKSKAEWTADAVYSTFDNDNKNSFTQQPYNIQTKLPTNELPSLQDIANNNKVKILTLQSDFVLPVGREKKGRFETGYKAILRQIDNDFASYLFDYQQNNWKRQTNLDNIFAYQENVHAAYGLFSNQWKTWNWQIGLRAEQTLTTSDQKVTQQVVNNNYFNLFPSLLINKTFAGDNEVSLSYSRRINRPNVNSLNSLIDYTDPLNLRTGNPLLTPEYINAFELGYTKNWQSYSISSTLYYRTINDVISRIRTVDSLGVATMTFKNLASGTSYGLELVSRLQPANWLDFTLSGNIFQTTIRGTISEGDLNNSTFTWNARFIGNARANKTLSFQVIGNYNAPNIIPQGTFVAIYGIDLAIKKEVFKGKGSLTLNVSDLFDWREFGINQTGTNFVSENRRKRETQVATLNFMYRFGSKDFAPARRRNSKGNEGDMNGGGGGEF